MLRVATSCLLDRIGNAVPTFEAWFAELLGQSELNVRRLLNDGRAIRFLLTWAIFEPRCFDASANEEKIYGLSRKITRRGFDEGVLSEALEHFHARYQDKSRLRHLLHGRKAERLRKSLALSTEELSPADRTFLVLFVVFRFRNNMFHGNKGVAAWLQYGEEIRLCTEAMQSVITYLEKSNQREAA